MAVDSKRGQGSIYNALTGARSELPFQFPSSLAPGETLQVLPEVTEVDLRELRDGGWTRLGVVAAVMDETGRILLVQHKATTKTEPGSWGPLAETSAARFGTESGSWLVEHPAETLQRGLKEEVGISDPSVLDLRAAPVAAWQLHHWPVGHNRPVRDAFAICPTVIVPRGVADLVNHAHDMGKINTEETQGAMFLEPDEVMQVGPLRQGTLDWLQSMKLGGILDRTLQDSEPISLPISRSDETWRDVIFDQMSL